MEKIQFDHSKDTIPEIMGVNKERHNEIFEVVKSEYFFGESTISKHLEAAIEKLSPSSAAEYLIIGMEYILIRNQVQGISKRLDKVLSEF